MTETIRAGAVAPPDAPYALIGTVPAALPGARNLRNLPPGRPMGGEFYWPPYVPVGTDLDAGLLWWRKVGSPSTAPTNVLCGSEGIAVSPGGDEVLKCVTGAASRGLSTTWTYANERRIRSGKYLACLVAVYIVTAGRTLTTRTVSSTPTTIASTATATVGAWVTLALEPGTQALDGTTVTFDAQLDGSGTFYVVPLGALASDVASPLAMVCPARGKEWVDGYVSDVVSGVDPGGGSWTAVDLTSSTHPLAIRAQLLAQYLNSSAAGIAVAVRRTGSGASLDDSTILLVGQLTSQYMPGAKLVALDDGQNFDYDTAGAAGNAETLYLSLNGYERWA